MGMVEPNEEYAQIQQDERESMSLIFPDDVTVHSRRAVHPISYSIKLLVPNEDAVVTKKDNDDDDDCYDNDNDNDRPSVYVILEITYPPEYPDVAPYFRIHKNTDRDSHQHGDCRILNLHSAQEQACLAAIHIAAETEVVGMPCVMGCIHAAKEFIESGGLAAGCINSLSDDLLAQILVYLNESPQIIETIATALPIFSVAARMNGVWKPLCWKRWKGKWGFHQRFKSATEDVLVTTKTSTNTCHHPLNDNFWYNRYQQEEKDAVRPTITLDELSTMVFDVRKWFDPMGMIRQQDHNRDVMPTGLYRSESSEVCFLTTTSKRTRDMRPTACASGSKYHTGTSSTVRSSSVPITSTTNVVDKRIAAHGWVVDTIHPSTGDSKPWFLQESGLVVNVGSPRQTIHPELTFQVRRLDTWGWELRTDQYVMRAKDVSFVVVGGTTTPPQRGAIQRSNALEQLWRDYTFNLTRQELPGHWIVTKRGPYPYRYREVPNDEDLKSLLSW